jgi:hypothetical protein
VSRGGISALYILHYTPNRNIKHINIDSIHCVDNNVDSSNSFGALIATDVTTLTNAGDGNNRVEDINIGSLYVNNSFKSAFCVDKAKNVTFGNVYSENSAQYGGYFIGAQDCYVKNLFVKNPAQDGVRFASEKSTNIIFDTVTFDSVLTPFQGIRADNGLAENLVINNFIGHANNTYANSFYYAIAGGFDSVKINNIKDAAKKSILFNNTSIVRVDNGRMFVSAIPSAGTWTAGDTVQNSVNSSGNATGWLVLTSGTFGSLPGTTGSIATGTNQLTVNTVAGILAGQYLSIVGVTGTKRILSISGLVLTLDSNADATVAGATVQFVTPTLQRSGTVDLSASAAFDPSSINSGSQITTTVSVLGAALGDYALASFSIALAGVTISAFVSASSTVTVVFTNNTGSPVDLGTGTLRCKVIKL